MSNDLLIAEKLRDSLEKYYKDMDASIKVKFEAIIPFIRDEDKIICDVGTGTGSLLFELYKLYYLDFPDRKYIGTDLMKSSIDFANKNLKTNLADFPNMKSKVRFIKTSADIALNPKVDIMIYSSILHEVYSYLKRNDNENELLYEKNRIDNLNTALKICYKSLNNNGRIIIRDFVRPENGTKPVFLVIKKNSIIDNNCKSFGEFLQYNTLGKFSFINYKCDVLDEDKKCVISKEYNINNKYEIYETNLQTVYEYIFRKDYCAPNDWNTELNERYGFWTEESAEQLLISNNFKIIHKECVHNPWILQNRLKDVYIFDESGYIGIPKYQMILVGQKITTRSRNNKTKKK
jgi:SAM-dependent methyltransferase